MGLLAEPISAFLKVQPVTKRATAATIATAALTATAALAKDEIKCHARPAARFELRVTNIVPPFAIEPPYLAKADHKGKVRLEPIRLRGA